MNKRKDFCSFIKKNCILSFVSRDEKKIYFFTFVFFHSLVFKERKFSHIESKKKTFFFFFFCFQ